MEQMKNVHLIPTDKPSRLLYSGNNKNLLFSKEPISFRTFERSPQNIYITNDEEIKEGDWYISILENEVYKATKETQNIMSVANLIETTTYKNTHFKIILTTDQDLINDGVQAIDDEFLEWFVKNPSCEEVEVEEQSNTIEISNMLYTEYNYEIIVPQKESKQIKCYCGHTITCDCEPKQETLEEAACKALGYDYNDWVSLFSKDKSTVIYSEVTNWCKGAKYMAERMYSKEECYRFLHDLMTDIELQGLIITDDIDLKKWFEQFKKK
jgi:hypothetical protein